MSAKPNVSTDEVRRQTALHIARYWAEFAKNQLVMVKEAIKQVELHYQEASKFGAVNYTPRQRVSSTDGESSNLEPQPSPLSSGNDGHLKNRDNRLSTSVTPVRSSLATHARRGKAVSFSAIGPLCGSPRTEQPRTPYPFNEPIDDLSIESRRGDSSPVYVSRRINQEADRSSEPLLDPDKLLSSSSTVDKDISLPTRRASAPQPSRSPIASSEKVSINNSCALPYRPKLRHPSTNPLSPVNIQLTSPYLSDLERQRAISRYMDSYTFSDLNASSSPTSTSAEPPTPKQHLLSTPQAEQEPNQSEDLIKGLVKAQQTEVGAVEDETEDGSQTGERFKNLERQLGGICGSSNIPTPTSSPNVVQFNSFFPSDLDHQVAIAKRECDRLEAAIKELTEQKYEDAEAVGAVGVGLEKNDYADGRRKNLESKLGGV